MKRELIIAGLMILCFSSFPQSSSQPARRKSPQELLSLSQHYALDFSLKKTEAEQMARLKGWPIRAETPAGGVIEIMELGPNGMPEYNTTYNLNAAKTTGTNKLWPGGASGLNLTGEGFTIAEWDEGSILTSHQEFNAATGGSRVTQKDAFTYLAGHSTHVAGTLIAEGDVNSAHGMAPMAHLDAYDWDNDFAEMLNANAVDNIILSNHSYGRVRGWSQGPYGWYWYGDTTISSTEDYQFGFYSPVTKTVDSLAYVMQDFLFVRSAGNDRGDSHTGLHYIWDEGLGAWIQSTMPRDADGGADGYDCIPNQATAKNVLSVGAVEDITGGYSIPADVVITSFSSWGPTDDGRIKPDIVANGSEVYSTYTSGNSSYMQFSGTSMASPNVCGTLALLQDYYYDLKGYYMYADEVKALVINTAYEAGTSAGPDYCFGWGLMNAVGAANLITQEDEEGGHIDYYTLLHDSEVDEYIYYADGTEDINVTVVWIDPPHAAISPSLNPTTYHLVNDIDVRISRVSTGTTYYPWKLNPASPSAAATKADNFRDNVEKITITSPAAGQYRITVIAPSNLSDDQFYAMVVSGMSYEGVPGRWTGATSSNWNISTNWDNGVIPDASYDITIPSGCPYYPVLSGTLGIGYSTTYSFLCNSLRINAGGILTLSGTSLYCQGDFDMGGVIYVGNDVYLNNGAVVDLLSGSLYTGYSTNYHGVTTISSGATVNQTGGSLYTEELKLLSGCQYNGSGGYCRMYTQGYATTHNIDIDDADSYFYNFYVENGTGAILSTCTADLDATNFKVYGSLDLNGLDVTAGYSDIYGTLTMAGGTFNTTTNGPYFQAGSVLNMSGGNLDANQSLRFLSGSTANVSDGWITLLQDLYNEAGTFIPSGGNFSFEGSTKSDIIGSTTFFNLYINKAISDFDGVENGTGNGLGADINVLGMLDIQAGSLELNSPGTLTVTGPLIINNGAALNANDNPIVNIMAAGAWTNSNLTGGFDAGNYSVVTFNAPTQPGVQIVQENNRFNKLIINSGAPYVRPSVTTGFRLIHANNIDIVSGTLRLSGMKVIVDNDLNIWGNLMVSTSADSLIVDDIIWKSGSTDNVSDGKILVNGSWTWEDGTNASITAGNLVRFQGTTGEFINSYDPDASFYNLEIDKGTSTLYLYTLSTQPVHVLNNLTVKASSLFNVQNQDLMVDGTLDIENGATLRLYNNGSVDLVDDFTLNGQVHLNTGGDFYVHGAFQEAITGLLNIQAGNFIVDVPYSASRSQMYLNGSLTMSGGVLEITYNDLKLPGTFNGTITGGTIRTGQNFYMSDNIFTPAGGAVEFIGTTSIWVSLASGCYFHDLWASKTPPYTLTAGSDLTVKGELKVKSSVFSSAGKTITIGP